MLHPFGNDTVSPPAQWHPEPYFRGTWSVLSSCLTTMFLCIWTAVHLNLPEHKKEHMQKWRKLGWLVLGLIAPEVVAWNALEQRRMVKELTREMQRLYRWQHGIQEPKRTPWYQPIVSWWTTIQRVEWLKRAWHKTKVLFLWEAEDLTFPPAGEWPAGKEKGSAEVFWTDVHSWYVVMGGIAFETSSASKPFIPEARERIVLSAQGIRMLARRWPHLLPRLSRGDIEDKSKSDGLAKLITCWQATWFCIQCICRLAQGLSISLLELNVFGHAICALLIYVLWWNKPKDIAEPTKIVGEESHRVAAWMCNCSPIGRPMLLDQDWQPMKFGTRSPHIFWPCQDYNGQDPTPRNRRYSRSAETVAYYSLRDLVHPCYLDVEGTRWEVVKILPSRTNRDSTYVAVDTITRNRLSLMQQLPQIRGFSMEVCLGAGSVRSRIKDWCINLDFVDPRDALALWQYLLGITLACALYGGLHSTAWHAPFPSSVEQLFWRASSATVSSSGIGCMILVMTVPPTHAFLDDNKNLWFCGLGSGIFPVVLLVCWSACLWYGFCRSFLVVESFINVTHLSASDLTISTWSSYVPHIG